MNGTLETKSTYWNTAHGNPRLGKLIERKDGGGNESLAQHPCHSVLSVTYDGHWKDSKAAKTKFEDLHLHRDTIFKALRSIILSQALLTVPLKDEVFEGYHILNGSILIFNTWVIVTNHTLLGNDTLSPCLYVYFSLRVFPLSRSSSLN